MADSLIVSLPTEEQKSALIAKGWFLCSEAQGEYEKWRKEARRHFDSATIEIDIAAGVKRHRVEGPTESIIEGLSILGLLPSSDEEKVMVPKEVAQAVLPLVKNFGENAETWRDTCLELEGVFRERGDLENEEKAKEYLELAQRRMDAWVALIAALSPDET